MPKGIYTRVKPVSDETRKKLSVWKPGRVSGMKGKTQTALARQKIKENTARYWEGKNFSDQHRTALSVAKGGSNRLYGSKEYDSVHRWIKRQLGSPASCSECNTKEAKVYDWANISQLYKKNLSDWKRLCRKCHVNYDHKYKRGTL